MQEIAENVTDLIGWLNNHGKVRKTFDQAQLQISQDCIGKARILAYLLANITRWTTHCVAFMWLFLLGDTLRLAIMMHSTSIVAAQVGAATSAEKWCLTEDAEAHCNLIWDPHFWEGLEQVIGDIEPICYDTNICQKDSTWADQTCWYVPSFSGASQAWSCKGHDEEAWKALERLWPVFFSSHSHLKSIWKAFGFLVRMQAWITWNVIC